MSTVIFSVRGGDEFVDPELAPSIDTFPELMAMRDNWRSSVYPRYTLTRGPGFPQEYVQIEFEPVPTEGALIFEYHFDESFLNQLVVSYAHFGWPIIAALDRKLRDKSTPVSAAARTLFTETRVLLLTQIEETLSSIERQLSQFARQNWTATIDGLRKWRQQFTIHSKSKYWLANRPLAEKVHARLRLYDSFNVRSERLERQRKQVDHANRYEPGKNDEANPDLFRAYGREELELRKKKLELASELFTKFPPALFVLDDLANMRGGQTKFKGIPLQITYQESEVENKIALRIDENIERLRSFIKQLDLPLQCQNVVRDAGASADGVERFVARRCIDTFDKTVRAAATIALVAAATVVMPFALTAWFTFKGIDANPALGYMDTVNQYWRHIATTEPHSWRRVVLQSYQNALMAEVRAQEILDAKLAFAIRVFKWVEAGISILAFMVAIVATDGALLAVGVPLICRFIGTAASILSVSLLAVTVLELKMVDNANKKAWQESLLRLSLEDVDTVNDVGAALGRLEAHRRDTGVEIVKLLIQLAVKKLNKSLVDKYQLSSDLNVAQHALDLEILSGDLETITTDTGLIVYEVAR